jgi:parallel beta-helix repeat protein
MRTTAITMKTKIKLAMVAVAILSTLSSQRSTALAQGSLTPPGSPAPTMKSLAQIEPRTAITVLPSTTTQSGSYYFVTNLTGVAGNSGITIATSDVTIDLKGFALIGVPGSVVGVDMSGLRTNITICNGTIRDWGGYGIRGLNGNDCIFQNLRIFNNLSDGLNTGPAALVKDCVAERSASYGISAGPSCVIAGCSVRTNGDGIYAGTGSVVTGCSSFANSGYGISTGSGVTVQSCSAHGNGNTGISTQDSCTILGCSVTQNSPAGIYLSTGAVAGGSTVSGCTVTANLGDGIYAVSYANRIVDNTCSYNGLSGGTNYAGIRIDGGNNRVENNNLVLNHNRGLRITVAGNVVIRNTASGNGVNYDITGTQTIGPDVTSAGVIMTNNPWANFEY